MKNITLFINVDEISIFQYSLKAAILIRNHIEIDVDKFIDFPKSDYIKISVH